MTSTMGLQDGNILSDIENISEQELRERLVVAEMIMKKLYSRNKDLEMGIGRAQIAIKQGRTGQNFYSDGKTAGDSVEEKNMEDENSDVEIEIGCSECPKAKTQIEKLQKTVDEKINRITELEGQLEKKLEIDPDTYLQ